MDIQDLVQLLATVKPIPPLRIYSLAWRLVDGEGNLIPGKVWEGVPELREATAEAEEYIRAIRDLRARLERCLDHS